MTLSETAAELIRTDPALANEVARQLAPSTGGMTDRQIDALEFIKAYARARDGLTPSFTEIMEGIGLHSKAGVHRLVVALKERGFIDQIPGKARSIVLKVPV